MISLPIKVLKELQDAFQNPSNTARPGSHKIESKIVLRLRWFLHHGTATLQWALTEPTEYSGGQLCFFVNDKLHILDRPVGSLVCHPYAVLHGVTALTSDTRKSLFVVDQSNRRGEKAVIEVSRMTLMDL